MFHRIQQIFFVAVLLVFLNACGDIDNSIPPAALTDYEQTLSVKENWSYELGGGSDLFHKIKPVLLDGKLYTISAEGLIHKIDLDSGKIEWQQKVNHKIYAGLAASNAFLVVATSDGYLNAYKNQAEQELVWSTIVGSEINTQPIIDANDIYVRLSNGQLNSYNLLTGAKQWSVSKHVPKLSLTGASTPIIHDQQVISGFDDGSLSSIDRLSGEAVWNKKLSQPKGRSAFERMVDVDGEFVIKNNIIYVSNFQGRLAAIQLSNGNELWSRSMSSVKAISSDEVAIFVSDQDSNLWAIDRRTGSALWKQEALHHRQLTGMSIVDDNVVVADFEGYAHWLDKESGSLKARVRLGSDKIMNSPIVYKNQILFLGTSNRITSVNILP